MKEIIVLFICLLPIISGCDKDELNGEFKEYIEIAWNSLTEDEKSTVIGEWEEAHVEATSYQQKSVYAIRFNTSYDALLGPIIVYIDVETKKVLGQALRD